MGQTLTIRKSIQPGRSVAFLGLRLFRAVLTPHIGDRKDHAMMPSQHERERQVKVVINRYQQDAMHARQLKMAGGSHLSPIVTMGTSIRASVNAVLATLHSLFIHHPSSVEDPAVVPGIVEDPITYGEIPSTAPPVKNPAII
jgi:hypothetical protein